MFHHVFDKFQILFLRKIDFCFIHSFLVKENIKNIITNIEIIKPSVPEASDYSFLIFRFLQNLIATDNKLNFVDRKIVILNVKQFCLLIKKKKKNHSYLNVQGVVSREL